VSGLYGSLFDGQLFDRQFVGGVTLVVVNLILLAVAVTGIVRWERDRARARGGLVVPRFYETAGAKNRGTDTQLMVLDALAAITREVPHARVHGIGAVVDLQHQSQASRLLRRLRAHAVLHGRTVDRSEGGWTVHARLAIQDHDQLIHFDWHTNDATPGKTRPWAALFSKLPSTHDVSDAEFPLELSHDLEALVRATAGALGMTQTPAEAEALLRRALEASPDSKGPAMDRLRSQLALIVFFQGDRTDEGLALLRARMKEGDAFGELLRMFALLAGERRRQIHRELGLGLDEDFVDDLPDEDENPADDSEVEDELTPKQIQMLSHAEQLTEQAEKLHSRAETLKNQAEKLVGRAFGEEGAEDFEAYEKRLRELDRTLREESIAALAAAAKDIDDPGRDISLYNLVNVLLSAAAEADENKAGRGDELREDAWDKLDELQQRSSYYRRTWYVKRLRGVRAWMNVEKFPKESREDSAEAIEAAREAARWYSAAIRARPRVRLMRYGDDPPWRRYRLRSARSPILDANAFDAHALAKHRWRARYHHLRFQLRRRALVRGAYRDLMRGYLDLALGQLDWSVVGRHRPELNRYDAVEAVARASRDEVQSMQEDSLASQDAEASEA
jgi:hypothetical protein